MRTIYKYPLSQGAAETILNMPAGFVARRVAMQGGVPTLWAEVDTEIRQVSTTLRIIGTGHAIPENGAYLGTCDDGPFVWHVFQMIG